MSNHYKIYHPLHHKILLLSCFGKFNKEHELMQFFFVSFCLKTVTDHGRLLRQSFSDYGQYTVKLGGSWLCEMLRAEGGRVVDMSPSVNYWRSQSMLWVITLAHQTLDTRSQARSSHQRSLPRSRDAFLSLESISDVHRESYRGSTKGTIQQNSLWYFYKLTWH